MAAITSDLSSHSRALVNPPVGPASPGTAEWVSKRNMAKRDLVIKKIAIAILTTLIVATYIAGMAGIFYFCLLGNAGAIPLVYTLLGVAGATTVTFGGPLALIKITEKIGEDTIPYYKKEYAQKMVDNLKKKSLQDITTRHKDMYENVFIHNLNLYGFITNKAAAEMVDLRRKCRHVSKKIEKCTKLGVDVHSLPELCQEMDKYEEDWKRIRETEILPHLPEPYKAHTHKKSKD